MRKMVIRIGREIEIYPVELASQIVKKVENRFS